MRNAQSTATPFDRALAEVRAGSTSAESAASALISQLTDDEVLWLLDGDISRFSATKIPAMMKAGPVTAAALPRIGFPGIRFSDGPRGVVMGASTAFPVTMARAATWDPELEQRVGQAMGLEARAQGANYSGAVCVNLLRHPAWGRAQECYGEDPVLVGQMGAALTRGLRPNVMACVKHFALNSMENARFKVDVVVDAHALHEVYLPHFKTVIDAGAESVMSAYNSVNGHWAGESRELLTDILRDEWGFSGFVTSDWVWGIRDGVKSLEAGMDVEMPLRMVRARELLQAMKRGRVTRSLAETSARRVIATTLRHLASRDETDPPRSEVACDAHRSLARLVAARGMVLLKNEVVEDRPILPLDASELRRVAVIGRLATEANIGDHGSSNVHPPETCSPLDGIRAALSQADIVHADGSDIAAAAKLAASADLAIVVAGMGHDDEGEMVQNDNVDGMTLFGFPFNLAITKWLLKKASAKAAAQFSGGGDRRSLTLKPDEEALLGAVAAANPRTVAVLIGGSAILMERWRDQVPAILMAWYPGMEGGHALADVLTGAQEPGGRLPFAIPTDAAHLPFFDPDATRITYDAWWGQRMLDRDGHHAAFRLGHGLGYSSHELALLATIVDGMTGKATIRVANTGSRKGATVAQLYALDAELERPIPQLIGFARIDLSAGESAEVEVDLDLTPMHARAPETKRWARRSGAWHLMAAVVSPDHAAIARALAEGSALELVSAVPQPDHGEMHVH
jgi:beta-glucosidase